MKTVMLMMIVVCVWRVCPRGSIKDNDNRQQGAILGGPEYSQTLEKHQLFHRQLMCIVAPILWHKVAEYTQTPENHQLFHPHPMNCEHIWVLHTKYAQSHFNAKSTILALFIQRKLQGAICK